MDLVVFIIASLMVIVGAIGVVVRRHPVHCALSLVLTLFGVAVLFVSQDAQFLAAVQIIVYAGAIVVLFLFVIMLLGVDRSEDLRIEPLPIQRPLALVMGLGIVGLLVAAVVAARDADPLAVGTGLDVAGQPASGQTGQAGEVVAGHDANIQQLADNLFGDNVFAFELTSVLLIVAVAGTVVLTRRQRRRAEVAAVAEREDVST
jgi:NADH-quinone oxidoreductase subunit J